MTTAYEERDRKRTIVGLDASAGSFVKLLPNPTSVPQFCSYEYVKTDSTANKVLIADVHGVLVTLNQIHDRVVLFSDGRRYRWSRRTAAPRSVATQPDIHRRVVIRESRYIGSEWNQGNTVVAETELPRGVILGRELSNSGRLHIDVNGQMLVASGSSGTLTLKLYYSTATDPLTALGSFTAWSTHTVTIADPAGGTGLGDFTWMVDVYGLGDSDTSNKQTVRSFIEYRRHSTDTPQTATQRAQTTINLRADTMFLLTTQKSAGWSAGRFNPYSIDGFIENGASGLA